ncbi:hypothetical protein DFH06DRAFT_1313315 [Mycena polygramma]|nr:hypothetical protein DFH06DRAFT_1315014 [Mycena polygramma]KAJ7684940.1 hypothetical protein DFH06DRAFT_1313315 [Mycena polygramma]
MPSFSTTPRMSITRLDLTSTLLDPFFALGGHAEDRLLLYPLLHLVPFPAIFKSYTSLTVLVSVAPAAPPPDVPVPPSVDPPVSVPPRAPSLPSSTLGTRSPIPLDCAACFSTDEASILLQLSTPSALSDPSAPSGPTVSDNASFGPPPPPHFGVLPSGLPDIEAILSSSDLSSIDRDALSRLVSLLALRVRVLEEPLFPSVSQNSVSLQDIPLRCENHVVRAHTQLTAGLMLLNLHLTSLSGSDALSDAALVAWRDAHLFFERIVAGMMHDLDRSRAFFPAAFELSSHDSLH